MTMTRKQMRERITSGPTFWMAGAYDALVDLADEEQVTLGAAARRVMDRARSGTLDARPAGS